MVMKAMPYTGYLVLRQIVIMSWQVREGVSLMGLGFPPQATVQQPADVADLSAFAVLVGADSFAIDGALGTQAVAPPKQWCTLLTLKGRYRHLATQARVACL